MWVWIKEIEEYETRFVAEEQDASSLYFDTFGSVLAHLNQTFQSASREAGAIDWTRTKELSDLQLRRTTLHVAAFVFTATVCTMLYLIASEPRTPLLIVTTILGIVSSGVALFFGRWITISPDQSSAETAPLGLSRRPVRKFKSPPQAAKTVEVA